LEITAFNYQQLQEVYGHQPITFLKIFNPNTKWPAKLRQIFADIWLGRAGSHVIIKACRGGGKSFFLGSIGFCLWFFKKQSIVDMAGGMAQAKIVYNNFTGVIYSHPKIETALDKEPLMEMTTASEGHYFKCVTASPKQVRGPHPDVLMVDEACEVEDGLLGDALPMVNTSENPLTILTSTFHKVFGVFQETWDEADRLGYKRYSWDIFDIIKTFDPAIWDDKELNREIPDLNQLRDLAKGRTGDSEGWMKIENIIKAWRAKRSYGWFLVEYMGQRPSAEGLINNPEDIELALFDNNSKNQYNYIAGAECIGGIDWGFSSMTAVVELMSHQDGVKVQIDNKNYTQVRSEVIIDDVVKMATAHKWAYCYCDSAGKFENAALQFALKKAGLKTKVIEVVFSTEKENMLGNYRAYFERQKIKIHKDFKVAIWQHKRYKYAPGTDKPAKKDDHIPDATMCALSHWPLGQQKTTYKDMPETHLRSQDKSITAGIMDERF
jgi:hypothetical protein